ncbi:MAG: hypothetical protein QXS19_05090 [Candidatus Methanomethylicia archaeon]
MQSGYCFFIEAISSSCTNNIFHLIVRRRRIGCSARCEDGDASNICVLKIGITIFMAGSIVEGWSSFFELTLKSISFPSSNN